MRKLNIILILFYALELLCQHDIYAPREDLLKKYGIKEYTILFSSIENNNIHYGNPHKYYLNKNGKVILEEYLHFNNYDVKVEYKYNDSEVLISKAYYPNHSNNHERMYTYSYTDKMILKAEWVFDSLDNVEEYTFYNENGKPVERQLSKNLIKYYYNENDSLECEVFYYENDTSEQTYFYENGLLKQIKNNKGFQPSYTIFYEYDVNNNTISRHDRNINGEITYSKLYEYDNEQRLTKLRHVIYGPDKNNISGNNNVEYGGILDTKIQEELFKYNKMGLLKKHIVYSSDIDVKFITEIEYK